jgi:adenine-specific DNA-methyltransferase
MPSLNFKGKTFVQNHHLAVKYHQLLPEGELSLTDKVSLHDNLIIHGDNLKALKALLPTYNGKVKCVYIDPPYNTGNENWVYNDNVNSPMIREWLGKIVDKDDLTRHDKWLCMMMPRLKLLREFLSEDGIILISCDDNELYNLRVLLEEIFSESNWVGTIIWRNVTDNNPTNIAIEHEYIVCFAKNKELLEPVWKSNISDAKEKLIEIGELLIAENITQEELQENYTKWFRKNKSFLGQLDRYKYIDKDGVYTGSQSVHNPGREGYRYDVIHPITKKPCEQPLMGYRFPESTMKDLLENKKILFGKDESKIIELKVYAKDYEDKLASVIQLDGRLGSYDLKEIFPENKKSFDNPKPVQLLKQLFSYFISSDDIILDSFSGSATTAHAILEINKEDEGNRKFILIEQEDYVNDITAERVRRVINGVKTSKNDILKNGTGGTFSFFKLGETIEMESLLKGEKLPSFKEFARYLFYTATGEQFNENDINENTGYIGVSKNYEAYLFYKPDLDWLKKNALTLELSKSLPKYKGKQRLVFAPAKYIDDITLLEKRIDFCQLPYEIYRIQK